MPLTPNNREEHWLKGVVDGETTLTPNNREEHWYKGMVDGSTDLTPNKRKEYWYKEIVDKIGSGGGGGSSDWTTAEVTITAMSENEYSFICFFDADEYYEGSPAMVLSTVYLEETPTTVKVPLYKGKCLQSIVFPPDIYEYTGGVELSMELGGLLITGNGTISPK